MSELRCDLPSGELRERRVAIQVLLQKRSGFRAEADGVVLEFPFSEDTAHSLLELIFFERGCCSGFRYLLDFCPPHTAVCLRITAPPEQVEALQALYR